METSLIGKVCPYCQSPIKPDANVVVCNACGIPHHAECWQQNGRCTTYGCAGAAVDPSAALSGMQPPIVQPLGMQPTAAPPPPGMPFAPTGPAGPSPSNGLAIASLVLGLLGFCTAGLTSIVGLILGIIALNRINRDPRLAGGKGLAIGGIIASAILAPVMLIAVVASILFPVFAKAREKSRQAMCTSNQRQLAVAIQMYAQDNSGQYPGVDWVNQLSPYLGGSAAMFVCPSDENGEAGGVVSYGYSGLLMDGAFGIKEANVLAPSEVGATCDAGLSPADPPVGIIGLDVEPINRHSQGIVMTYCDGHAVYISGGYQADPGNEVFRAFEGARQAGLLK